MKNEAMKTFRVVLVMFWILVIPGNVIAKKQTITLVVENMTCSLCPVTVKKALKAVEGVHEARVSLEAGNAVVTFDDEKLDVHSLIVATTNAGFPSTLTQEDYFDDAENP